MDSERISVGAFELSHSFRSEHELGHRTAGEAVSFEPGLHVRGPETRFREELAAADGIVAEPPGLTRDSHRTLVPENGEPVPHGHDPGFVVSVRICTG